MKWLDSFTAGVLLLTSGFSYVHEEYGTALVAGVCAGFVGGLAVTKMIVQSRDRRS